MDPRERFSPEAIAAGRRAMEAADRLRAETRADDSMAEENASVEADALAEEKARRRIEGEALARARDVQPIAPAADFTNEAAALAEEWRRRRREGEAAAAARPIELPPAAAWAPLVPPRALASPILEARAAAAAAAARVRATLDRPSTLPAAPATPAVDFEGETPPDRR